MEAEHTLQITCLGELGGCCLEEGTGSTTWSESEDLGRWTLGLTGVSKEGVRGLALAGSFKPLTGGLAGVGSAFTLLGVGLQALGLTVLGLVMPTLPARLEADLVLTFSSALVFMPGNRALGTLHAPQEYPFQSKQGSLARPLGIHLNSRTLFPQ